MQENILWAPLLLVLHVHKATVARPGASPVICPPGTYSAAGAVVCSTVPAGYYTASEGSASYTQCEIGSYSTGGASVCSTCSPGYRCPAGSTSPSPLGSACAIGGYCSSATSWTYTTCPAGYYGVTSAGQSITHACKACDGYYCPTQVEQWKTVLAPCRWYCPMASANRVACPAGYYSSLVGQTGVGTCIVCPAGSFCLECTNICPCQLPRKLLLPSRND